MHFHFLFLSSVHIYCVLLFLLSTVLSEMRVYLFFCVLNIQDTTYISDEDGMAATVTLGRVDEFDGTRDDWLQYIERLEHFFVANGIDATDKKRTVLLSVVGAATYKMLQNIISLSKPGEKSYTELLEALSKYFKPIPSEIIERLKFHSRVQKAGESIANYIAELQSLLEYCNFSATLNYNYAPKLPSLWCE